MPTETKEPQDKLARARQQAKAQYDSIAEMIVRLRAAEDDDAYAELAPTLAADAGFIVREGRGGKFRWLHGAQTGMKAARRLSDSERHDDADAAWLACCDANDLRPDADAVRQEIQEDPLSVQVRSGWYTPGATPEAEEFEILLCTGGPAVRIIGQLGMHNEPDRARLECQDWFTSWTEAMAGVDGDVLLAYARCFYFGD